MTALTQVLAVAGTGGANLRVIAARCRWTEPPLHLHLQPYLFTALQN